ncbi:hypothetical protein QMO56_25415 [Roseomonas sp. E05]|uniref:hypothetical protein n=1 Tax=Roseomonas sp. E05 TaxID=3046310 RepID=UPI0024BADDD4|nr:hypothetical protein [Roseomonas sp. E05]MDJ0391449.1 hypothetical protein [Roseomonas sp. E05]
MGETDRCAQFMVSWITALAGALGVQFADLVRQPDTAESRRTKETAWRGRSARSRAVLPPPLQGVELWSWSLDMGERYEAGADPAGWHELFVVIEGRVQILEAGACAVSDSSKPCSYENAGTTCLRSVRNVTS